MDLRRQLAVLRGWWPLLLASVVLAGGAGFFVSTLLPRVYEAKTLLMVGQSLDTMNPDLTQMLASQRLSTTYANIATTRPILAGVIERLELDESPEELRERIEVTAPLESTLLTITAQDPTPAQAAAIADALADELIAASPTVQGQERDLAATLEDDIQGTREQIAAVLGDIRRLNTLPARTPEQQQQLDTLDMRLADLRSTLASLLMFSSSSSSNLLSVLEPAVAPTAPISPRPLLNAVLAALVGLMTAAAVIALVEYLDDTIKTAEEVEATVGLPTLGGVVRMKGGSRRPEMYRLAALLFPRSALADAYRNIRTNIEFASVDQPVRTLLVTSSVAGEGKTVTAANLAVVFAQTGRRVLLLDADLRKPSVHAIFDKPNQIGLTTMIRSDRSTLSLVVQPTEVDNLDVMTSGPLPPNPAELVGSNRMRTILDEITEQYQLVVVDSPPLIVSDAAVLSSILDGTVLVIDASRTGRGAVRHAYEALARSGGTVLGAVLNRLASRDNPAYSTYYGSRPESTELAQQMLPQAQTVGARTEGNATYGGSRGS